MSKQGSGTLKLNGANTYSGTTQVWGGTLEVVAVGNLGQIPIVRINNNGRFVVAQDVDLADTEVVIEDPDATYEHAFSDGGDLSKTATVSDGNTTAYFAAGTSSGSRTVQSSYLDGRLTLEGLDGNTFLLVLSAPLPDAIDPMSAYLGWFDPSDDEVKNAVDGNKGQEGVLAGFYDMTWEEFIADNGAWNPATMLGAYGTDLETRYGLGDHRSQFRVLCSPRTNDFCFATWACGYGIGGSPSSLRGASHLVQSIVWTWKAASASSSITAPTAVRRCRTCMCTCSAVARWPGLRVDRLYLTPVDNSAISLDLYLYANGSNRI